MIGMEHPKDSTIMAEDVTIQTISSYFKTVVPVQYDKLNIENTPFKLPLHLDLISHSARVCSH